MGDCWLGLKASKFPHLTRLCAAFNDSEFVVTPLFSVSSVIIFIFFSILFGTKEREHFASIFF
jgi:hypothetical protein